MATAQSIDPEVLELIQAISHQCTGFAKTHIPPAIHPRDDSGNVLPAFRWDQSLLYEISDLMLRCSPEGNEAQYRSALWRAYIDRRYNATDLTRGLIPGDIINATKYLQDVGVNRQSFAQATGATQFEYKRPGKLSGTTAVSIDDTVKHRPNEHSPLHWDECTVKGLETILNDFAHMSQLQISGILSETVDIRRSTKHAEKGNFHHVIAQDTFNGYNRLRGLGPEHWDLGERVDQAQVESAFSAEACLTAKKGGNVSAPASATTAPTSRSAVDEQSGGSEMQMQSTASRALPSSRQGLVEGQIEDSESQVSVTHGHDRDDISNDIDCTGPVTSKAGTDFSVLAFEQYHRYGRPGKHSRKADFRVLALEAENRVLRAGHAVQINMMGAQLQAAQLQGKLGDQRAQAAEQRAKDAEDSKYRALKELQSVRAFAEKSAARANRAENRDCAVELLVAEQVAHLANIRADGAEDMAARATERAEKAENDLASSLAHGVLRSDHRFNPFNQAGRRMLDRLSILHAKAVDVRPALTTSFVLAGSSGFSGKLVLGVQLLFVLNKPDNVSRGIKVHHYRYSWSKLFEGCMPVAATDFAMAVKNQLATVESTQAQEELQEERLVKDREAGNELQRCMFAFMRVADGHNDDIRFSKYQMGYCTGIEFGYFRESNVIKLDSHRITFKTMPAILGTESSSLAALNRQIRRAE